MAADRVFTDEELRLLGERTLDLLSAAIDSGDREKAKKLGQRLGREFQGMHDLYLDWITGLLSFIYRRHGDEELNDALVEACTPWVKPVADLYATLDFRRRAQLFAGGLRGHMVPMKVEEDDEKITFMMQPCGSGGKMELEKAYDPPKNFAKVKKAQPMTWGMENVSVYCAHCSFQETMPIDWHGAPMVVTFPPSPDKIGLEPCRICIYKDPNRVPEGLYRRVGKKKA